MRKTIILPVVLTMVAAAVADEVNISGVTYSSVLIIGSDDFTIRFQIGYREVSKSIEKITSFQIDGKGKLNEAEVLRAGKQWAQAVKAYDAAWKQQSKRWVGRLIRARRLAALGQARQIGRAVADWLVIADDNASKADLLKKALALVPEHPAEKGSKENARAIKLLEAKGESLKNADYLTSVRRLLLRLYRQEGKSDKAAALAEIISGKKPNGSTKPSNGGEGPSGAEIKAQLEAAGTFLERGDADRALRLVQPCLKMLTPAQLPAALVLQGKAQLLKYKKTKERDMLLKAGLNFMRVVVYYRDADEAPEALFLAGEVNAALGNKAAARQAFDEVAGGMSKFAAMAKRALEKLGD